MRGQTCGQDQRSVAWLCSSAFANPNGVQLELVPLFLNGTKAVALVLVVALAMHVTLEKPLEVWLRECLLCDCCFIVVAGRREHRLLSWVTFVYCLLLIGAAFCLQCFSLLFAGVSLLMHAVFYFNYLTRPFAFIAETFENKPPEAA